MRIQLNIVNGEIEDIQVLKNIMDIYGVRTEYVRNVPEETELGTGFVAALILVLPELTQLINAVLPAIQTYIIEKKPSGTKHSIELVNGEKKICLINEDGSPIDIEKIADFCNKTDFFNDTL